MPHIPLPAERPGIIGLLEAYPETGTPLRALAQQILRAPSPLTPAERELIATAVSAGNECRFCTQSHAAAARSLLRAESHLVDDLLRQPASVAVSPKLRELLLIAEKVRVDGRGVTSADVYSARSAGATDRDIHDTVLIAAAFSMYNRYVDGLSTAAPADAAAYALMGGRLATEGYVA